MPAIKDQEITVNLKLKDEGFKQQLTALGEYLESLKALHKDLGEKLQKLSRQAERVDELFEIKTKSN